jgi:hypothetical protein
MRLMLTRTVLLAALLVMTAPAGAVTFDDGLLHVIDVPDLLCILENALLAMNFSLIFRHLDLPGHHLVR